MLPQRNDGVFQAQAVLVFAQQVAVLGNALLCEAVPKRAVLIWPKVL